MAAVTSVGGSKAAGSKKNGAESESDASLPDLSDAELLHAYRQMLEIRHFEEACNKAFRAGKVGGYLHLYVGQEAVSLGVVNNCKHGDQFISSYRDHAHCLALGSDPGKVMAEIYGRSTGLCKGKGGSMHLFDKEHGFCGGYGIVGGHVPLSVGVGWALKYKRTDNICVCFVGDGAMNAGAFHEALNMAALYKLRVLYVLENNQYAMGTSVERSHANTDLASRADSYAIPRARVDGQDYLSVYAAVHEIVAKMRREPYPYFLETVTYRYVGHGAADDAKTQATYRTPDEVEDWRRRDPITLLGANLRERGALDDEMAAEMDEAALKYARDAAQFADASPLCGPEELFTNVLL